MKTVIRPVFGLFLLSWLCSCTPRPPSGPPSEFKRLRESAVRALDKEDYARADFYMARYLGLATVQPDAGAEISDLNPLFARSAVAAPTSLINGAYDQRFLDWFVYGSYVQWAQDRQPDEKGLTMLVAGGTNSEYCALVSAAPFVEGWFVTGEPRIWAAVAVARAPRLNLWSQRASDQPADPLDSIVLTEGYVQHLWTPEFADLDGDARPELWIRYNETYATGFEQVLAIYRIDAGGRLALLRMFTGEAEGIARRTDGNRVEVARGFGEGPHLAFDRHHFELWEFRDGTFVKAAEHDLPHLLHTEAWEKYYLDRP